MRCMMWVGSIGGICSPLRNGGRMTSVGQMRGINDLSPTEFENVTYDSLRSVGLKNLIWRTPGADGGRDIEGYVYLIDPTGHESQQKWYVECKRYEASVDWPTVWKKLSYADSNAADVFLLSTNSNPSPACETQIAKWNFDRRRPAIRVWRGYEWKSLLATFPDIALSYGLGDAREPHDAVGPITSILTKVVQSAYMTQEFGQDPARALELAAAIAELITKRLDEIARFSRFAEQSEPLRFNFYPWLDSTQFSQNALEWDEVSVRALLSFLRYKLQVDKLSLQVSRDLMKAVSLPEDALSRLKNSSELALLAKWCRLHVEFPASGELDIKKYE